MKKTQEEAKKLLKPQLGWKTYVLCLLGLKVKLLFATRVTHDLLYLQLTAFTASEKAKETVKNSAGSDDTRFKGQTDKRERYQADK